MPFSKKSAALAAGAVALLSLAAIGQVPQASRAIETLPVADATIDWIEISKVAALREGVIDRMELPPRGRMTGVPHMPGTREYLTCETGEIVLAVAGEQWRLAPGDVMTFRGDQRHSYANPGARLAVGYSVVLLAPVE